MNPLIILLVCWLSPTILYILGVWFHLPKNSTLEDFINSANRHETLFVMFIPIINIAMIVMTILFFIGESLKNMRIK